MRKRLLPVLLVALLCGLAGPRPAPADDTALLNRVTPAPNVLVILDTSQSMTWYKAPAPPSSVFTRGDEYTGWTADNTPKARMAMAKEVMSTVVDTYFDRLRLGLASYAENGTGTPPNVNPNAAVRIKQYIYYCGNNGTWCTSSSTPNPPRQYIGFTPGSSDFNNLRLWVDSTNINMPTQNTFTLNWALDTSRSPNPQLNTSGGGPNVCRWNVAQTNYNHAGAVTSTSNYTEIRGTAPCPAAGTTGTVTETESFNYFNSGDDPTPWKYRRIRSWTGYTVYGAGCSAPGGCLSQYATDQGSGWTNWSKVYSNPTSVPPSTTSYSWTYYYKGTCTNGCSGYLTTSRTTGSQSTSSPVLPSPLTVPFTRAYTWSGNNYEMNPPSAENSCPVGAGVTMLVDVGGAPDKDALKTYLGTGPDKRKELHGANFYTPLATSLDTVLQYFLNPSGAAQTDPIKDCRRNYVILVTDGGESCPLVPTSGPGSPGDKALALRNANINAFGGAPTFVVGLDGGTLSTAEQAVLDDIAIKGSVNGDGDGPCAIRDPNTQQILSAYCKASDTTGLTNALNAIIGSILSQQYTFVNPVVPTVRSLDNLMLIQGSLVTPSPPDPNTGLPDPNTPLWQGVLEAFQLDNMGNLSITAGRITQAPLWEAGALLAARNPATRVITTVVGGAQVDFQPTPAVRAALNVAQDLTGDGAVTTADPDRVIQVVRGGASGTQGFLGDIFHSVPIVVGPSAPTFVDRTFDPANPSQLLSLTAGPDTFAAFRAVQSTRQRVAIVGTNAGVLHAFNAGTFDGVAGSYTTGDGAEVWAFIPPQMLPRLQALAVNGGHQYFVDGSPRVADVWLDLNGDGVKASDGSEWRTILVGGFRQGGTGLYALDITDTTNPVSLWTYATTGQSWSEPAFGKVKVRMGGRLVDRWVVFVGDGYDPTGVNGRMVHVIDLQTGRSLWQLATTAPVAAGPMVVDLNNDGYVDRVYVGTLGGDLLRLDVSAVGQAGGGADVDPAGGVMVANWSGGIFFAAGAAQPFYTKVAATLDPQGNLWIFAGGGDRSDPLSVPPTPNRIFGIKDPYQGTPIAALTEADLTDMTGNNTLTPSAVSGAGWVLILRPGEKEFAEASLVFNQQVFFTTFMPGNTTCGDLGSGSVYMVFYLTGGGVTDTALFRANPPVASSRIYQVNAGATTRPVLTTGVQGANAVVYLGNSNMLMLTPAFSTPTTIRSTRYWRPVLP